MKIYILLRSIARGVTLCLCLCLSVCLSLSLSLSFSTLEIFLGDFNSPWFVSRSLHTSSPLTPSSRSIFTTFTFPFPLTMRGKYAKCIFNFENPLCSRRKKTFITDADSHINFKTQSRVTLYGFESPFGHLDSYSFFILVLRFVKNAAMRRLNC